MKASHWLIAVIASCLVIGCSSGGDDTGFQEPPKSAGQPSGNQPIVSAAEGGPAAGDSSSASGAFGSGKR